MNNSEVIKHLSERLGLPQREVRRLLKGSTEIFKRTLDQDLSFTIPQLGTLGTHVRQKRRAYNPHHKRFMMLPPKRVASFHQGSALRDHIRYQRVAIE